MLKKFVTSSVVETQALAQQLATTLRGGDILCLYGALAAGKTTFTQGLGQAFGVERIISPTYIIQRQYSTNLDTIKRLNHIDLYRLDSYTETKSFDLDEVWSDSQAVTIIEWPDRLKDHLPSKYYLVKFEIISDHERQITIAKI